MTVFLDGNFLHAEYQHINAWVSSCKGFCLEVEYENISSISNNI